MDLEVPMAKILCIDDYKLYSEAIALMIAKRGNHEVKVMLTPFHFSDLVNFRPDIITLNLVRKMEVLGTGLHDFDTEVEGAKAYRALADQERLPAPVVVTAIAIREDELPKALRYVAYIEVPHRMDYLMEVIESICKGPPDDLIPM